MTWRVPLHSLKKLVQQNWSTGSQIFFRWNLLAYLALALLAIFESLPMHDILRGWKVINFFPFPFLCSCFPLNIFQMFDNPTIYLFYLLLYSRFAKEWRKYLDEEARIMKDVPGWTIPDDGCLLQPVNSVPRSGKLTPPLIVVILGAYRTVEDHCFLHLLNLIGSISMLVSISLLVYVCADEINFVL